MEALYLVTGAAGHVGGTVVQKLLAAGRHVRGLVLPGEKRLPEGTAEICFGDVRDPDSLAAFFSNPAQRPLIVIHCAGIVSITSKFRQDVYDVNVTGTRNMLTLCHAHHVHKLVHVSSVHAIPELPAGQVISEVDAFDPDAVHGLYAKTKAEATAAVLAAAAQGLPASVVHPSGICGPGDPGHGHITALVRDYSMDRLYALMHGGYDFVDVRDVADGILACYAQGRNGACYILSNRYVSVKELAAMLHEITGRPRIRLMLPGWFLRLVAPLAELYYAQRNRPPLFTAYSLYTLRSNALFSHEKASAELGFAPRDFRETLTDTVRWLQEAGRLSVL